MSRRDDRVPDARWRGPIADALKVTQPWIHIMGEVRFVCGVDPVFAGIHRWATSADGRPYSQTAHCCYPTHLDNPQAVPTIILPTPVPGPVIVHELGHVLDFRLGFERTCAPVTDYATVNRREAFAEYFTAHLLYYGDQDAWGEDDSRGYLDSLRR